MNNLNAFLLNNIYSIYIELYFFIFFYYRYENYAKGGRLKVAVECKSLHDNKASPHNKCDSFYFKNNNREKAQSLSLPLLCPSIYSSAHPISSILEGGWGESLQIPYNIYQICLSLVFSHFSVCKRISHFMLTFFLQNIFYLKKKTTKLFNLPPYNPVLGPPDPEKLLYWL